MNYTLSRPTPFPVYSTITSLVVHLNAGVRCGLHRAPRQVVSNTALDGYARNLCVHTRRVARRVKLTEQEQKKDFGCGKYVLRASPLALL